MAFGHAGNVNASMPLFDNRGDKLTLCAIHSNEKDAIHGGLQTGIPSDHPGDLQSFLRCLLSSQRSRL